MTTDSGYTNMIDIPNSPLPILLSAILGASEKATLL